ncbi:MAG: FkbM family methyltransferase [Burkholderiaceae bacterium]|nr:FkbM family methyltransferase [Burkholderiaceae bacterium]
MKLENPWIAAECRRHDVAANPLPTHLPPQFGQLGEDLILEAVLRSYFARAGLAPAAIRYLDIGANHPIQTSNTYLFATRWGGRGVLVEANPALIEPLRRVRTGDQILHFAVVPPGHPATVTLSVAACPELSSLDAGHMRAFGASGAIARTVEVPSVTLDELLQHCFPQGLHLLSLDIEGLDLDVIRTARLPQRPVFIVTEPSRHVRADADAQFEQALRAKGYVEVARTEYNLIYGDAAALGFAASPAAAAPRRLLRTFDVFDTLIARHCIRPEQLFVEMERRSGLGGFAQARFDAEREVEGAEYGLADIYAALARRLALSSERADELLRLELQLERENVVPVRDNLQQLDGDCVLVTDTYLPAEFVADLLRCAGLDLELPVVRTSAGKRSGQVWRDFRQQGFQCVHLGDHPVSDVRMAAAAGARPAPSTLAEPTPMEKHLYCNGFPAFARMLRSARLEAGGAALPRWLYRLQVELNLPVLIAAAATLLWTLRGEATLRPVLFASRDGRALKWVFDALAGGSGMPAPVTEYWWTSRVARVAGSAAYLDYCRERFAPLPFVVDLCGTGASIATLFERLALEDTRPPVFLCEYVERATPPQTAQAGPPLHVFSLLSTRSFVDNEVLELLNAAPEGMVRDVVRVAQRFVPVRDAFEFDGEAAALLRAQAQFVRDFCRALPRRVEPALFEEIAAQGAPLLACLHDALPLLRTEIGTLTETLLPAHRRCEVALASELDALGAGGAAASTGSAAA